MQLGGIPVVMWHYWPFFDAKWHCDSATLQDDNLQCGTLFRLLTMMTLNCFFKYKPCPFYHDILCNSLFLPPAISTH